MTEEQKQQEASPGTRVLIVPRNKTVLLSFWLCTICWAVLAGQAWNYGGAPGLLTLYLLLLVIVGVAEGVHRFSWAMILGAVGVIVLALVPIYTSLWSGFPFGSLKAANATAPLCYALLWTGIVANLLPALRTYLPNDRSRGATLRRAFLIGFGAMLLECVLEPAAVGAFAPWYWHDGGIYYGIPLAAVLSWFPVGFLLGLAWESVAVSDHMKLPRSSLEVAAPALNVMLLLILGAALSLREGCYGVIAPALILLLMLQIAAAFAIAQIPAAAPQAEKD